MKAAIVVAIVAVPLFVVGQHASVEHEAERQYDAYWDARQEYDDLCCYVGGKSFEEWRDGGSHRRSYVPPTGKVVDSDGELLRYEAGRRDEFVQMFSDLRFKTKPQEEGDKAADIVVYLPIRIKPGDSVIRYPSGAVKVSQRHR